MPVKLSDASAKEINHYFHEGFQNTLTHLCTGQDSCKDAPLAFLQQLQGRISTRFKQALLIIDNSGSTKHDDGKFRCVEVGQVMMKKSLIIDEICQRALDSLACYRLLGLPCYIAPLNPMPAQPDSVYFDGSEASYQICCAYIKHIRSSVGGPTPILNTLKKLLPKNGGTDQDSVVINIITDGVPTEELYSGPCWLKATSEQAQQNLIDYLKRAVANVKQLNLVVNLATDDDAILDTYNTLLDAIGSGSNKALEMRLKADVIDDWYGEAKEIEQHNPDLTYSLPLHLLRQSGVLADQVFDLIDEQTLSNKELLNYCSAVLGIDFNENLSLDKLANLLARIPEVYDPLSQEKRALPRRPFKPIVDPKAVAHAVISQQRGVFFDGWFYRLFLYFKLYVMGDFLPTQEQKDQVRKANETQPIQLSDLRGQGDYSQAQTFHQTPLSCRPSAAPSYYPNLESTPSPSSGNNSFMPAWQSCVVGYPVSAGQNSNGFVDRPPMAQPIDRATMTNTVSVASCNTQPATAAPF